MRYSFSHNCLGKKIFTGGRSLAVVSQQGPVAPTRSTTAQPSSTRFEFDVTASGTRTRSTIQPTESSILSASAPPLLPPGRRHRSGGGAESRALGGAATAGGGGAVLFHVDERAPKWWMLRRLACVWSDHRIGPPPRRRCREERRRRKMTVSQRHEENDRTTKCGLAQQHHRLRYPPHRPHCPRLPSTAPKRFPTSRPKGLEEEKGESPRPPPVAVAMTKTKGQTWEPPFATQPRYIPLDGSLFPRARLWS